jgi:hypothetical protein
VFCKEGSLLVLVDWQGLELGVHWVCDSRFLALYSKLRVPTGQQGSQAARLELSGVHQTAVALGSTCIGVWASRNHGNCCQLRTEPAGSGHSRG